MRRLGAAGAALIAVIAADAVCGRLAAEPAIEPFAEFVQGLATAPAAAFVGQPEAAVAGEAALEEMRRHLLQLYDKVDVKHSFALDDQVFDCVPIEQQPGVRLQGLAAVAEPPPVAAAVSVSGAAAPTEAAAAGSTPSCDAGTVPMRRVTLAEVSRFKTLSDFLRKGPNGAGRPSVLPLLSSGSHGYAHEYSRVTNYGGYSLLSLWDPKIVTKAPKHEIFSLAQHWYVGGITSGSLLQTAEVGWQNYPQKYHTKKSVLFIYWTADGYQRTGCYNLDCAAFVQTDNRVTLGGPFASYSQVGGAQQYIGIGYYLYQGAWWLAVNGSFVGYFPTSIYRGGQMSKFAQEFDMGGETVGYPYWPAMGSGQFADRGFGQAAYHEAIVYRDSGNGGHAPSLTVSQPSTACWTATSSPAPGGSDWGTYFYFGGPGGMAGTC